MPYIDSQLRLQIDDSITDLSNTLAGYTNADNRAGVLNYTITKLLLSLYKTENYKAFNEVMGILSCIQQEMYRKKIVPYEDKKCELNGEVF